MKNVLRTEFTFSSTICTGGDVSCILQYRSHCTILVKAFPDTLWEEGNFCMLSRLVPVHMLCFTEYLACIN